MVAIVEVTPNNSLQRTTPAPRSGIAACNRFKKFSCRARSNRLSWFCAGHASKRQAFARLGVAAELERSRAGCDCYTRLPELVPFRHGTCQNGLFLKGDRSSVSGGLGIAANIMYAYHNCNPDATDHL